LSPRAASGPDEIQNWCEKGRCDYRNASPDLDRRWRVWLVWGSPARSTLAHCKPPRIIFRAIAIKAVAPLQTNHPADPSADMALHNRGFRSGSPNSTRSPRDSRLIRRDLRLRIVESSNSVNGQISSGWETVNLAECIRRVAEVSNWKETFRNLPEGHGVGSGLLRLSDRGRAFPFTGTKCRTRECN